MPRQWVVKSDTFHYKWSRSHKPVLYVRPGDRVTFDVNEVTTYQVTKNSKKDVISSLDVEKLYPLSGPVCIEGAEEGDALVVDVLSVKPASWGWSAIIPGLGLLEEFDRPFLWVWDLKNRSVAPFKKGLRVPLRPFCGVYGVAPREDGFHDVMPPGLHGGNMDIRHLTAGSRLLLPVHVEGALFSVGDVHGAQGDGEVCVTAIECPGQVTLRFDIRKDAAISSPQYFVPRDDRAQSYFGTTGISPDLWDAAKRSVRGMIEYLTREYGLTGEEAYVLCSVAADLRIHEIVDRPNWVVGTVLPLSVFPRRPKEYRPPKTRASA